MRIPLLNSILFLSIIFLSSCGGDDDNGDQRTDLFQAIVVYDTAYNVGSVITLDASTSLGIDGASVEWIYQGGDEEIQTMLQNDPDFDRTKATTSFTAKRKGQYSFNLRLTKNGRYSEYYVYFNVVGIVEITSLSDLENNTFKNLDSQSDPNVGDYLINSVIVIPEGETYYVESGVTLKFGENGAIIVQGSLYESQSSSIVYCNGLSSSWKGIYISGRLTIEQLHIDGGGNASFTSNNNDIASIYLDSTSSFYCNYLKIHNSLGYGVIMAKGVSNVSNSSGGSAYWEIVNSVNIARISSKTLGLINFNFNVFEDSELEMFYEQIFNSQVSFQNLNFTILDSLVVNNGSIVFNDCVMKFNPGAYLSVKNSIIQSFNSVFTSRSEEVSVGWKGILTENSNFRLSSTIIEKAGLGIFPGISEAAAITQIGNSTNFSIENSSEIKNNFGYGINSHSFITKIGNSTFSNNQLAHIRCTYSAFGEIDGDNTFDGVVTAVKIFEPNTTVQGVNANETIKALGNGNYYEVSDDLEFGNLLIEPNVLIKMDLDKFIEVSGSLTATASQNDPIVIESLLGNRGDWQGIHIKGNASMNFVSILNAGRNSGATTFNSPFGAGLTVSSLSNRVVNVTNCEITNAGDYGVVIRLGASDHSIDSLSSNNTLEGALGGYFDAN